MSQSGKYVVEQKILGSNGAEYFTVALTGGRVEFKNFGLDKVTIVFDAKCLDQLIPALQEANFWEKSK